MEKKHVETQAKEILARCEKLQSRDLTQKSLVYREDEHEIPVYVAEIEMLAKITGYHKENYGDAYILLAQLYASSPNWNDEAALNKCTYFVVIDKLQRAKAVDPTVADKANELISTYARYTPKAEDLFMLGIKAGDRVTVGGWIGESTTVR